MEHLGIARMEAATWRPTITRPRLTRPAWRAVLGRFVAATVASATLAVVATAGRPAVPDVPKALVRFDQAYTVDGRPVSRTEWTGRALGAWEVTTDEL